jgi:hypothetical protein
MWDIKNEHKKQDTLSIWKAEHNKLVSVLNVPRTRITDVGILVRRVTDNMPDSQIPVHVKTAENYTSSEHICNKVSRTFQSYPFKRLLFLIHQILGYFQTILRQLYCTKFGSM